MHRKCGLAVFLANIFNLSQWKQQLNDSLYRNSLFLIANTVTMSVFGFIFWTIVARFYVEADVGLGSAIISAVIFLAMLGTLGLDITIIRSLPKAENPVDLINSCFTIGGIAALAVAAIFIAGMNLWSPVLIFIRQNAIFATVFVLFAPIWALSELMNSTFIAMRRADFVLWKNTSYSLVKIILVIILSYYFHAFSIIASWSLAMGVAVAIYALIFLPRAQKGYKPLPRLNLAVVKDIRRYSAGNYFANLLGSAPPLILPIMVVNLLGTVESAYFYMAWMVATLLFIIPRAASQSLLAEGSHFEVPLELNVRRSFGFIFLLLIPAVVILCLLGKWVLFIFGSSYAANASQLIRVLGISSIFVAVNEVYKSILRVEGRIRELVVIVGLEAVAILLASYFIMPIAGIIGVGYVWIAAKGLVSIYAFLAMRPYYLSK